jgi:hypothetical protein
MQWWQSDYAAISQRLRGDGKAIAQRLRNNYAVMAQRLRSDGKAIAQRLRDNYAVMAQRLRSICAEITSFCKVIA